MKSCRKESSVLCSIVSEQNLLLAQAVDQESIDCQSSVVPFDWCQSVDGHSTVDAFNTQDLWITQ